MAQLGHPSASPGRSSAAPTGTTRLLRPPPHHPSPLSRCYPVPPSPARPSLHPLNPSAGAPAAHSGTVHQAGPARDTGVAQGWGLPAEPAPPVETLPDERVVREILGRHLKEPYEQIRSSH